MGDLFKTLYQLAGREKRVMMTVGVVCALFAGVAIPINAVLLGHLINIITLAGTNETGFTDVDVTEEVDRLTYYQLAVATTSLLAGYGAVTLWSLSAVRLGANIRQRFFLSLLAHSVAWFEVNKMEEVIDRYETDIPRLERGIGDKIPICLQWMITWLSSYIVAFTQSYKLSLAILVFFPIIFLVNRFITKKVHRMAMGDYQTRMTAGLAARDELHKVNTIHAFSSIQTECQRYKGYLQWSWREELMRVVVFGLGSTFPWVVNALAFVVIFGYGNFLVHKDRLRPGNVIPVFVGILFALAAVQQVVFHLDAITAAHNSIKLVMEILDSKIPINYFSGEGRQPARGLQGRVLFRGVCFRSPRDIRVKILNNLNMHIKTGESVAVLGNSSVVLSAIPKLIKRIYDINKGQILIDGVDIREYNVRWLRHRISYVTKDTVIFPISIAENLKLGHYDVTQEEIEAAAKDVDLHDFVTSQINGYRTVVCEKVDLPKVRAGKQQQQRGSTVSTANRRKITFSEEPSPRQPFFRRSSNASERTSYSVIRVPSDLKQLSIFARSPSTKPIRRDTLHRASRISSQSSREAVSVEIPERRKTILWANLEDENSTRNPIRPGTATITADKDSTVPTRSVRLGFSTTGGEHVLWKSTTSLQDTTVTLTASQRMQVAIARALVKRPAILMLEDVFCQLDPPIMHDLLKRLTSRKQTTLLITDSLSKACCMERVVVVGKTRKLADGSPALLTSQSPVRYLRNLRHLQDAEEKRKMSVVFKEWRKKCKKKPTNTIDRAVELLYARHLSDIKTQTSVLTTAMVHIMEDYSKVHTVVTRYPMVRVLRVLGRDVVILCVGLLLSLGLGLTHTALAFCVGHFIVEWYELKRDVTVPDSVFIPPSVLVFIMLGSAVFVTGLRVLEHACFSFTSIRLTTNVRSLMFEAMLKQDLQFFDQPDHSPLSLAQSLTHDTEMLQAIVGVRLGAVLESISALVAGLTLALTSDWMTAVLLSAFGPLALLGSLLQGEVHLRAENCHGHFMKEAREVFLESVENINTITNLNMKQLYRDRLNAIIQDDKGRRVKYAHLHGAGYAAVSIVTFTFTTLLFLTFRIFPGSINRFPQVFTAFTYMVFGLAGVDLRLPQTSLVGYSRAKAAASRVFSLIDSPPMVNPPEGGLVPHPFIGLVRFRLVNFHYPHTPNVRVLYDINLNIRPGATTALVGPSGSGKSTIFKLIERFYDVHFGSLDVDDIPLHELDLEWWRQQVCMMQDNPDLAGDSVKDVITYGDSREDIPLREVVDAATFAGIHDFIMTLPRCYDTIVEEGRMQVFNKEQRLLLGMARAVFRKPRLLLVDNITQSVHPNSAKVLNIVKKMSARSTCIIATNHVSEITHADFIIVMSHGHVIEQGTHEQLLAQKGCYFMMLHKQAKDIKYIATKLQKKEEQERKCIQTRLMMADSIDKHQLESLQPYSNII